MEGSVKELSRYRFRRAEEEFCTADILLEAGQFKASINRFYYSIFHALRSVTALDHFDSGKHSGVIAYFNRHYIKEGVFDKSLSKMIDTAYRPAFTFFLTSDFRLLTSISAMLALLLYSDRKNLV